MKSRSFTSRKNNGFVGQFKNLNNNEMINLRGGDGGEPPLPPSSGEDLEIDPYELPKKVAITTLKVKSTTTPTLVVTTSLVKV